MAKILFIVDQLPFPARNGLTITSSNILKHLVGRHEVSLILLKYSNDDLDQIVLGINEKMVSNLWILEMVSPPIWKAAFQEVICAKPIFANYSFNLDYARLVLKDHRFDIIWAFPVSSFAQIDSIEECISKSVEPNVRIAAINEPYTYSLRAFGNRIFSTKWIFTARALGLVNWFRSWGMAIMENRILRSADKIIVQAEIDKVRVGKISNRELLDRTVVISNGAKTYKSNNKSMRNQFVFGHIGPLASLSHSRTIRWILDDVFPQVHNYIPRSEFFILGLEGSPKLMRRIRKSKNVKYIKYVNEINDFYDTISVLLVWNYKHQGLVTRTIEAMSAGVVVIGEPGTFSGINDFEDGIHGLVVTNTKETVGGLVKILLSETIRRSIANEAQELINRNFLWKDKIRQANSLIEDCMKTRCL